MRLSRFILLLAALLAMANAVALAIYDASSPNRAELAALMGWAVLIVPLALMSERVGYRWFDAVVVMIPIYNLAFIVKMVWRYASLPRNEWPPR